MRFLLYRMLPVTAAVDAVTERIVTVKDRSVRRSLCERLPGKS